MAIVTLADLKAELAFSGDLGAEDDALLTEKITAAQQLVEGKLGYKIEEQFGTGAGQDPVPEALRQAVVSLAAHFYDARGLTGLDAEAPWWVDDIISEYRGWTF